MADLLELLRKRVTERSRALILIIPSSLKAFKKDTFNLRHQLGTDVVVVEGLNKGTNDA